MPVVVTLAQELPESMPKKALPTTAALAGPPTFEPKAPRARSVKVRPVPVSSMKAPNIRNRTTKEAIVPRGMPKIPPSCMNISRTSDLSVVLGP